MKIETLIDTTVYSAALQDALIFLPVYLFSVYVILYFILPKYFAKRNITFLILFIFFVAVITLLATYFISVTIFQIDEEPWYASYRIEAVQRSVASLIAITSLAVIIKIMKDYFFKQQENEILAVENARSKIQLLKMQMHPRILFECLHSINNDIDAGTIYAPEMILKLSELLSYLLYEGELKQVPLTKEIQMLRTYLELKKLELKDKISVDLEVSGETDAYHIIPVLFLPLLEIGIAPFEKQEQALVYIELKTTESKLFFRLKTDTPDVQVIKTPAAQTALESTKKRLQISDLYKFKLEIQSTAKSFAITLHLEPDKFSNPAKYTIQNNRSTIYEHI